MTEHSVDTVERMAKAIYNTLEGPVANQDYARQMRQHELSSKLARAALSALTVEDAAKVAEREARRQKSLVELAYSEGVLDASARSATVDNAGEKFATSDAKAASDDPLVHQLEWPDHYESSAIADTPKEGE